VTVGLPLMSLLVVCLLSVMALFPLTVKRAFLAFPLHSNLTSSTRLCLVFHSVKVVPVPVFGYFFSTTSGEVLRELKVATKM